MQRERRRAVETLRESVRDGPRDPNRLAFEPSRRTVAHAAQSRAAVSAMVRDGLHVGRRAGDHAQDLAGGRLLLQGLGEVGVLGLQLA